MGIVIIIGILIVITLYLIIRGSDQISTNEFITSATKSEVSEMSKRLLEVIAEKEELSKLRKQEIHNNYILTVKNRELQDFKSKVVDIMNDKTLLMINKIDEINKLLSSDKDNNTISK